MDNTSTFGSLLRRLRRSRDLSQDALAQRAACAHDTIKKLERGLRRPSRELAAHLADVFALEGPERDGFLSVARSPHLFDDPLPASPQNPPGSPISHQIRRLPMPETPFIGRIDELAALVRLLGQATSRLVTILAPGGMGKTRLALAATELLEAEGAYADGVAFADLTPLASPANLDTTVAAALGFPLDPNPQRSPRTQVLDYLREKQLLLVLDNCEHLREAVGEFVSAILSVAPGAVILITTRERLGLRAEQIFVLEGLQHTSDGMTLFAATAQAVQPRFTLDPAMTPLAVQICTRLGGMPLAIELAAGWADTLGLEEIAADVAHGDELLVATTSDTPERHRSIRSMFAGTWARLSAPEQAVFAQVAIFHGGATRRALQSVTGADLTTLKTLVGKALLRYDPERDRYAVHELLRQYAAERLAEDPTTQRASQERHAAYYLEKLAQRTAEIKSAEQKAALDVIGKDLENVRAAWDWVVQEQQWHLLSPEAITTLGYSLLWWAAYEDGLARFGVAADALAASAVGGDIPVLLPALLRAWQGAFAVMLGYRDHAAAILQQAQSFLPQEPDNAQTRLVRGFILLQQGLSVMYDGTEQADHMLEQSIATYDAPESRWEQSTAMIALGELCYRRGRFGDAERLFADCLAIRETYGDLHGMSEVLLLWSFPAAEAGRLHDAEGLIQRAVAIYQETGDLLSKATGWGRLGAIQQWFGRFRESEQPLRRSLSYFQQLGEPNNIAFARCYVAATLNALGSYHEALAELAPALSVLRRSGPSPKLAYTLWAVGTAYAGLKDWDKAEAAYKESITIYHAVGAFGQSSWSIAALAHVKLRRGKVAAARAYLIEALAPAGDKLNYLAVFYVLVAAARVLECYDRRERAIELYEMFYHMDLAITRSHAIRHYFLLWREGLRAVLPAEVIAAAEERGPQLDVWETISSLRQELEQIEVESRVANVPA